jgi:hypothetical protein
MQPLHKIYGLIAYLTCTIYFYYIYIEFYNLFLYLSKSYLKENCRFWLLKFIYISIPIMIQNHVKFNNYSIYMNMKIFKQI